ncbi:SpoIIE family protein phosphatase [Streptomyces siamensis]|uniref:PPM-type phosphatase domain-containing protein n=1 Tax=Streptomyces siamensis TaxID=1274986 RepID=A0ABP9IQK6_9ACTN
MLPAAKSTWCARTTTHVGDLGAFSRCTAAATASYTDGLIEDRSLRLDLEQGITVLRRAVHRTDAPLDDLCDALMSARPADSADDTTLLVTRLTRLQPVTATGSEAQTVD